MKRILLIVAAALLACTAAVMAHSHDDENTSGQLKDGPSIEFVTRTHDMGTIKAKDGKVHIEFAFTNAGDKPLVITSATASCGCTKPSYPEEPIRPEQQGVIKVTYNPANKAGEVTSTVTVRTNDRKNKKVTLKIKGVVIPK